jgi:hypothetical protein
MFFMNLGLVVSFITLGDQRYRVSEAIPNDVISLISMNKCRKVVSQTIRIFYLYGSIRR